jgi:homoaconitate hydratase
MLRFPAHRSLPRRIGVRYASSARPLNLVEKIATSYAVDVPGDGGAVTSGGYVAIRPRHVMTHDNTAAVMKKFETITAGAVPVFNPRQPVFTIDHNVQDTSDANLKKYKSIGETVAPPLVAFARVDHR